MIRSRVAFVLMGLVFLVGCITEPLPQDKLFKYKVDGVASVNFIPPEDFDLRGIELTTPSGGELEGTNLLAFEATYSYEGDRVMVFLVEVSSNKERDQLQDALLKPRVDEFSWGIIESIKSPEIGIDLEPNVVLFNSPTETNFAWYHKNYYIGIHTSTTSNTGKLSAERIMRPFVEKYPSSLN